MAKSKSLYMYILNILIISSALLIPSKLFALPLFGTWNTKCVKEPSGLYHEVSIEIHEDVWTKTDWWSSDIRCEHILLEKQTMYEVAISANNWDGKSLMSYIRPYIQSLADQFNAENLCGVTNWKHGRVIEVTGKSCKGFDIHGYDQILYSVIKFDGQKNNLMWMGIGDREHSGSSEITRHVLFSDQILVLDPAEK